MTTAQLTKDPLNLIIAGVGGQGNVMISLIVGGIFVRQGYYVTLGETYGASQRGGPVMSHLRISKETQCGPLIPDGRADIILGMEPVETMRILCKFGNPHTMAILNNRPIYSIDVTSGQVDYPAIDKLLASVKELSARTWVINATAEAQKMGSPLFANVILIGSLIGTGLVPVDRQAVEPLIQEFFPRDFMTNMTAFDVGVELIKKAG
ncbi:MAG: indolepyruvate oxidoreductase subunit beta [Syntrophales bacterium]|nr:indolepyruvate oxidoreductase subunit beta [Syntrophales bacterium]